MTKNNQSLNYTLIKSVLVSEINKYEGLYEKYNSIHHLNILEALTLELKKVAKHL